LFIDYKKYILKSLDCPAQYIYEQQHKGNWHNDNGNCNHGVPAAKNMMHGTSKHNTHISERMALYRFHLLFIFLPMMVRNTSSKAGCFSIYFTVAQEGQLFHFRKHAAHDNLTFMKNGDFTL
jgi:hypothetical protein